MRHSTLSKCCPRYSTAVTKVWGNVTPLHNNHTASSTYILVACVRCSLGCSPEGRVLVCELAIWSTTVLGAKNRALYIFTHTLIRKQSKTKYRFKISSSVQCG
jgi:hypothetical protein